MAPYIPRKPGGFGDAITRIRAALGNEQAADVVGREDSTLARWSLDADAAVPNIMQAVYLDIAHCEATGEGPPITEAMLKAVRDLSDIPEPVGKCLFKHFAELMECAGIVATDLREAAKDGIYDPREINRMLTGLHDLALQVQDMTREMEGLSRPHVIQAAE